MTDSKPEFTEAELDAARADLEQAYGSLAEIETDLQQLGTYTGDEPAAKDFYEELLVPMITSIGFAFHELLQFCVRERAARLRDRSNAHPEDAKHMPRQEFDEVTMLGANSLGAYRIYPWMTRFSWQYIETHDGHRTKLEALDAATAHRNAMLADRQKRDEAPLLFPDFNEATDTVESYAWRGAQAIAAAWDRDHGQARLRGDEKGWFLRLVTGGWSDNEVLLQRIPCAWRALHWHESRRGGLSIYAYGTLNLKYLDEEG